MSAKILQCLTQQMFPDSSPGIYVESIPSSQGITEGVLTSLPKLGWQGHYYSKGKNTSGGVYSHIDTLDRLDELLTDLNLDTFIHCLVLKLPELPEHSIQGFFKKWRFGIIICRHNWEERARYQFGYQLYQWKYGCYHRAVSPKHHLALDIYVARIRLPPHFYGQPFPKIPLPLPGRYVLHRVLKSGTGSTAVLLLKRRGYHHRVVFKKCLTPELYQAEKNALILTRHWNHSPNLVYFDDQNYYLVTDWCGCDLRDAKDQLQQKIKPIVQNIVRQLHDRYGIYHNDVRWKNIVRRKGRVVLVDWGFSATEDRERDPQGILS